MPDRSFLECWSLNFNDLELVEGFNLNSRIWAAFQLRFFRTHGRFPSREDNPCPEGMQYLGRQLDLAVPDAGRFRFRHVNARRHRVAILRHLGVRRATDRDRSALRTRILEDCRGSCPTVKEQAAAGYAWCLANSVHVPSDKIMERLVRGARHDFLEGFQASIVRRLPTGTRKKLDESLSEPRGPGGFHLMKADVGAATLDNALGACNRLAFLGSLDLPWDQIAGVDPAWIAMLCRRVEGENASEMWRHGEERRLFDIAEAAIGDPEGRVVDVIYPVAGVAKLKAVIDEHRARGTLDKRIRTVMRGSYAGHYRRMMPKLLPVLRFRSNNAAWSPILDALELIAGWRDFVVDGKGRLNAISYELCVLSQLRDSIRAREIWAEGADRHRNPDQDLPADFDDRRETYCAGLGLQQDARAFAADIRAGLGRDRAPVR